jgi:2-oxo-4-hydroxy-4-carboxy-5-ureidoimidazoline decarboxylase
VAGVDLDAFNAEPAGAAAQAVQGCADIPAWVEAVVAGRPYADVARLLARADGLAREWSDADVDRALAQHPRIGERGGGESAREQSGVAEDDITRARLRAGNEAYERRFGRVFLIRAAGRSEADVLTALHERLAHDEETERRVVAAELREIAILRLERLVTEEGARP